MTKMSFVESYDHLIFEIETLERRRGIKLRKEVSVELLISYSKLLAIVELQRLIKEGLGVFDNDLYLPPFLEAISDNLEELKNS